MRPTIARDTLPADPPTASADAFTDATCCPTCGREACEDHLPDTPRPAIVAPLTFASAHDVIDAPAPPEIIEQIGWAGGLTVLASESGTGKTFVLLDIAAAVSSGVAWHGRSVRQGSAAYLSFEGDALGLRLSALRDHTGHRLEHLYVLRAHDPLSPRVSRDGEERSVGEVGVLGALKTLAADLRAATRPPIRLLVIDTVRASLTGSEDSSEHVAAYLRAVRRIMAHVPEAAALLAHHAGWQDGEAPRKRERGSSAWRGNCDATLYLEAGAYDAQRASTPLTLRTLKARDGECAPPLHLIRRRVELPARAGVGVRQGPVTSCIIERDPRTREDREAERLACLAVQCREVDNAVLRAMRDHPTATSISRLRPHLAQRTEVVSEAVARILRSGFAIEGKRGQPYTLTEAGRARLNGSAD